MKFSKWNARGQNRSPSICGGVLVLVLVIAGGSIGQEGGAQPKANRSASEALLNELLPGNPLRSAPATKASPSESEAAPADSDRLPHPLQELQMEMIAVADRLQSSTVDLETRQLQTSIVTKLDQMIAQLDQTPSSTNSSSTSPSDQQSQMRQQVRPGDPATEDATTASSEGDEAMTQNAIKAVWGQLPERVRDQFQSPLREEFLPQYRDLIIEFYKRLAAKDAP